MMISARNRHDPLALIASRIDEAAFAQSSDLEKAYVSHIFKTKVVINVIRQILMLHSIRRYWVASPPTAVKIS